MHLVIGFDFGQRKYPWLGAQGPREQSTLIATGVLDTLLRHPPLSIASLGTVSIPTIFFTPILPRTGVRF